MIKDRTIFIKNIYYMLSYAFQSLRQEGYADIAVEQFDNIQNLFAAILARGISLQVKHGLYRRYVNQQDNISTLQGKLNMHETIKNKLQRKQKLSCEFDVLSENNLHNQILKTTVILLLKYATVKDCYKADLRKVLLYFAEIDIVEPSSIRWSMIRFQRNNQSYRLLIGICELLIKGLLLTTDKGTYKFATFLDEQRMCRLYEKFILEYYRQHYPSVSANAAQIPWALDDGKAFMLPKMQSDIMLCQGNRVLIIDAKYYSHTTQMHFDKRTLLSHNLYQIFTYVKNYDYSFHDSEHVVSGMLLYAKTEEDIQPDNIYHMHGNKISVKTLDLNKHFDVIKQQLDEIFAAHFFVRTNKLSASPA